MMSRVKSGTVRLDRALSKLGLASRAEAKRLIADGRVRVRGRIVRDGSRLVTPEHGGITVDGAVATARPWRTIAFHKPRGVVTTRRDPEGRPTVFDLLGDEGRTLVAVGRLDMASTGLLLLTTDTQLANYLTDPENAVVRRYVVTVRGSLGTKTPKEWSAASTNYEQRRFTSASVQLARHTSSSNSSRGRIAKFVECSRRLGIRSRS